MGESGGTPSSAGFVVRCARSFWKGPRIFLDRRGFVWSATLSYYSLLALIPVCVIGFAFLGVFQDAFELDVQVESAIERIVPEKAAEAGDKIRELIDRTRGSSKQLGALGFALLFLTAYGLFKNLEYACNGIWSIEKGRSLWPRLRSFWIVITLGPLLAAASLSLTARLQLFATGQEKEVMGPVLAFLVRLSPWMINWCAFFLLIRFLPNTRVRLGSAIFGALIGGSLWEAAKFGFNAYVDNAGQIDVLYGPLGILPIFIIWLQVSWVIALLGVALAKAHQN